MPAYVIADITVTNSERYNEYAKKTPATIEKFGGKSKTVYGLAANAYSNIAVKKIFRLKKRPSNNPLIVHYYDFKRRNSVFQSKKNIVYHYEING